MTQINHAAAGIDIVFPGWEAMMAGRRSLHVPTGAVIGVRVEPGWTSETLGMRFGLAVSGYRKLGTFIHPSGTRRLVSMKRGMPLLRLRTERTATGFDEVLISTHDAEQVAGSLAASPAR